MEKPILFSTRMVQAILDEKKSMTRRIVKPQPELFYTLGKQRDMINPNEIAFKAMMQGGAGKLILPKYQPSDILWVRETWCRLDCGCCEGDSNGICQSEPDKNEGCYMYRATHYITGDAKWKPSIFMPRVAARIFLRVTNVRLERLWDITENDARAEGFDVGDKTSETSTPALTAEQSFMWTWQRLYDKGDYPWVSNPWVFVYEFERTEAPK